MTTDRRGSSTRRRVRVAPAPISATIVLPGRDTDLESGVGALPPGMEDPFPLKGVMVRLFPITNPDAAAESAWSHANSRGVVTFSEGQVAGRPLMGLGLEVYARKASSAGASFEGPYRRWSFTIASAEVRGVMPDVLDVLGPGMQITVPDAQRSCLLWSTGVWDDAANRWVSALSSVTESHRVRRAFLAYAIVIQMRSWLWNHHHEAGAYPFPGEVCLVYPATSCFWTPEQRIYLGSGRRGMRDEYNFSALCHEYGHHFFFTLAPSCAPAGGTHAWTEDARARSNDVAFRYGIARDFAEGFATFIGQRFLQSARYAMSRSSVDIEAGSECSHGDLSTSAFLWDLADTGNEEGGAAESESSQVTLLALLRALRSFAVAKGHRYLVLPDYVDHLIAQGVITESTATSLYAQNHLTAVVDRWKALSAPFRNMIPPPPPAPARATGH